MNGAAVKVGMECMATTRLERVLGGERIWPPPIWLMRQAGRYLPEYRAVRAQAGSFVDLCLDPERAAEVSLQPVERFGLDAAIVFADILLVAGALGQQLRFDEGQGPVLTPALGGLGLDGLDREPARDFLSPVGETVALVRERLDRRVGLIGFCGGAWTVATYMAAGGVSGDHMAARSWAYRDPDGFQELIDRIVDVSVGYLVGQLRAGADAVKIFDSWAGVLPDGQFARWVIEPTRRMAESVRAAVPGAKVIGFARGAGLRHLGYAMQAGLDALAVDEAVPLDFAAGTLQPRLPVQGNLDPAALLAGGPQLEVAAREIVTALGGRPFVFNLGHGIHKDTPPEHVARLVDVVRGAADPIGRGSG
jgi:uroporphyrinogen decarboxylase